MFGPLVSSEFVTKLHDPYPSIEQVKNIEETAKPGWTLSLASPYNSYQAANLGGGGGLKHSIFIKSSSVTVSSLSCAGSNTSTAFGNKRTRQSGHRIACCSGVTEWRLLINRRHQSAVHNTNLYVIALQRFVRKFNSVLRCLYHRDWLSCIYFFQHTLHWSYQVYVTHP